MMLKYLLCLRHLKMIENCVKVKNSLVLLRHSSVAREQLQYLDPTYCPIIIVVFLRFDVSFSIPTLDCLRKTADKSKDCDFLF